MSLLLGSMLPFELKLQVLWWSQAVLEVVEYVVGEMICTLKLKKSAMCPSGRNQSAD